MSGVELKPPRPKIVTLTKQPPTTDIWTPTEHYDDHNRRVVEHTTGSIHPIRTRYEGVAQIPLFQGQPPTVIVFPIPDVASREAAFAAWDDLAEIAANDYVYRLMDQQKQRQNKILVPGEDMPPMPPEAMEKIMKLRR